MKEKNHLKYRPKRRWVFIKTAIYMFLICQRNISIYSESYIVSRQSYETTSENV